MQRALAENIRDLASADRIEGVRIGRITEIDAGGTVRVDYPGNLNGPVPAKLSGGVKSLAESEGIASHQQILLLFEDGDPRRPVIIDTVHDSVAAPEASPPLEMAASETIEDVTVDGKCITFDAREEIVLRCGKSSITLTRAGKIIIRGAYLLNRSSGVNRIKGASVQIN